MPIFLLLLHITSYLQSISASQQNTKTLSRVGSLRPRRPYLNLKLMNPSCVKFLMCLLLWKFVTRLSKRWTTKLRWPTRNTLQTKRKPRKQKRKHANKKNNHSNKNENHANKKETTQTKKETTHIKKTQTSKKPRKR